MKGRCLEQLLTSEERLSHGVGLCHYCISEIESSFSSSCSVWLSSEFNAASTVNFALVMYMYRCDHNVT